jgi:hypothetical protein
MFLCKDKQIHSNQSQPVILGTRKQWSY